MDSLLLGFTEPPIYDVVDDKSHSFKLVPWLSWEEWKFVKDSLFSKSTDCVASALQRISTWRSRGCIPMVIEVTASIIEIQQKDPFFRTDMNESASQSEEMLTMLYCMAIMRLVNGVVEKTRKKNEISIGEAADAIGIPRMLIDIRHEGSHRDLPSLQLVRLASKKAIDWLILFYWEPQEKAIPNENGQTENLRKEIKRKLREVALCLKANARSSASSGKGKRARQTEHLHGCNKFLLNAEKSSHSSSGGFKKQLNKSLKSVLRLYSSFSPEVVGVVLEYLLKAFDSSNLTEYLEESQISRNAENKQTPCDEWKAVVLKLSRKEPGFLLTLAQIVLEKMETQETINYEIGERNNPENLTKSSQIKSLSCLFEWLVENLKTLNTVIRKEPSESKDSLTQKHLSKATIRSLLRRCLLLSSTGNKQLNASARSLANLIGDTSLLHKLKKFCLLGPSNSVESCKEIPFSQLEDSIRRAEEKLESIKRSRIKRKDEEVNNSRWNVAKSWNSCPIGMLPHTIGFSGRVPILEWNNEFMRNAILSDGKDNYGRNRFGKRESGSGVEDLDDTSVKKLKDFSEADCDSTEKGCIGSGVLGHLLIDGVWKKVGEKEVVDIASSVRLLV